MKITWQLIALITVLLSATVAILVLVPEDNQQGRAVIVALTSGLAAILTGLYVKQGVEQKIDDSNSNNDDSDQNDDADSVNDEAQ